LPTKFTEKYSSRATAKQRVSGVVHVDDLICLDNWATPKHTFGQVMIILHQVSTSRVRIRGYEINFNFVPVAEILRYGRRNTPFKNKVTVIKTIEVKHARNLLIA
jgi:hypothetical protein